jgi:hypothetical protein
MAEKANRARFIGMVIGIVVLVLAVCGSGFRAERLLMCIARIP